MAITLKEVNSKRELKSFIYFPYWLYKGNPVWEPESKKLAFKQFDKKNNPIYNHADARLYLAMKDRRVAGRVAVFALNDEFAKQKVMRFGWLDFENDKHVSAALFKAIKEAAAELGAETVIGPTGFTRLEPQGILISGHQQPDKPFLPFHPTYAQKHIEEFGFIKSQELVSFEVDIIKGEKTLPEGFELKVPQSKKELARWILESASKSEKETNNELLAIQLELQTSHVLAFAETKHSAAIFDTKNQLVALAIPAKTHSRLALFSTAKKGKLANLIWLQYNLQSSAQAAFDVLQSAFSESGYHKLRTPQLTSNNELALYLSKNQKTQKTWQVYSLTL